MASTVDALMHDQPFGLVTHFFQTPGRTVLVEPSGLHSMCRHQDHRSGMPPSRSERMKEIMTNQLSTATQLCIQVVSNFIVLCPTLLS